MNLMKVYKNSEKPAVFIIKIFKDLLGSTCLGSSLARKYKTRVEESNTEKNTLAYYAT